MKNRSTRRSILKSAFALAAASLSGPATFARRAVSAVEALPVRKVADGVYAFTGAVDLMTEANGGEICNLGFVVGGESVAVIDSGGSLVEARALIEAISSTTPLPIRYLINTHMHPDHTFGNAAFADAGAVIVGHHNLPRALASRGEFYLRNYRAMMGDALMAGVRIVPPTRLIAEPGEIDLGGRTLLLTPWKAAHTDNDLTVLDRETGTLFTGDLCFVDHLPTLDGSIKGWMAQLDALAAIPAKRAIPGHGPVPSDWPTALEPERRYFQALVADIRKAISGGVPLSKAVQSAGESERGRWSLFDEHNERNATAVFAELEWE
ncbi:quinoprotein relay system zinc metallohydrolase 2 [Sinorhizobium sp. BG8]|uniref:quinoprotein relay system zinc metallohydrolase 2 n=1 Tax=Sinorhizobium sp. BG8 TaxID=2613773 RepID=UPI00193DABF9|nr:quinoprotein relay system zinc metallohydrolase 2 [Sinorhizobium sp. BG8]QRM57554.1 quinoprotein relay system zinc metallohydrolase 2 [Sinorhizobium sp. BG8]